MKILIFALSLLISINVFALSTYNIECSNNDIYTDLGAATINLNSTITVNAENDYVIEGGNLTFFIKEAWTDQDVEITKVNNYQKYKPRVYKSSAKFPSIGKGFFGDVDFLVPHKSLMSGEETEFGGVFIMSWVEDHWGGTIHAQCTLDLIN